MDTTKNSRRRRRKLKKEDDNYEMMINTGCVRRAIRTYTCEPEGSVLSDMRTHRNGVVERLHECEGVVLEPGVVGDVLGVGAGGRVVEHVTHRRTHLEDAQEDLRAALGHVHTHQLPRLDEDVLAAERPQ